MQKKYIILADCDCFYVSVERVFNPDVRTKPVVVLSNNDGCVVSSSPEAKKFGAKTGVAYFEIKKDFEFAGGVAFSANYTLYGDFSARVMVILAEFAGDYDNIEFYSVDEAYIIFYFDGTDEEFEEILIKSRKRILKEVGIKVSFCAANTKTQSKVGMNIAKKRKEGVYVFINEELITSYLKYFPVQEIWGIGRASAAKLKAIGVDTAWKLAQAEPKTIRKLLTVTGARLQSELQGISCIEFLNDIDPKKGITTSRSFLKPVYELEVVEKFISDHVFNATEKMRKTQQVCHHMTIFIYTNHFKEQLPQCYLSDEIPLEQGEDSPTVLADLAIKAMRRIFKYGYEYRKCGVILTDLRPKSERQLSLFSTDHEKNDKLTSTIDQINERFGPRKLKLMSCNKDIPKPDGARKSKRYTTNLNEILIVKI
jgi:DNA polymerase V